MSKIASIEKIHSIATHPNADKLLVAKILEWPVVIKKDEGYKDGDFVVFIQIDTIVDSSNPFFAFMEKQKWRTWNARFRGEPSSGLVCPLKIALEKGLSPDSITEGLEVSDILNCKHYEKPIDASVMGLAKGNFPSNLVSITDEDNLLSYPRVISEFQLLTCYLSLKLDGSSATYIHNNGETHICSRRLSLKDGDNAWYRIDSKYEIIRKLTESKQNLAVQGEIVGPKMNGNKLGLSELDFYVFSVKNLDTGAPLGLQALVDFCKWTGLKLVPVLETFRFDGSWNLERLRKIANEVKYPNGQSGEGIVIRSVLPRFSGILNKTLSAKIINQNYKD